MITFQTEVFIPGVRGQDVIDFLENCNDAEYQRWWPGTHLQFHALYRTPEKIGSVFHMDEYVGERHLQMEGVITEYEPNRRFACQMKQYGVRLPAWLELDTRDEDGGVLLTHTLRAGFEGAGRVLDPVLRLYLDDTFAKAMDEHAKAEFPKLGELLRQRAPAA